MPFKSTSKAEVPASKPSSSPQTANLGNPAAPTGPQKRVSTSQGAQVRGPLPASAQWPASTASLGGSDAGMKRSEGKGSPVKKVLSGGMASVLDPDAARLKRQKKKRKASHTGTTSATEEMRVGHAAAEQGGQASGNIPAGPIWMKGTPRRPAHPPEDAATLRKKLKQALDAAFYRHGRPAPEPASPKPRIPATQKDLRRDPRTATRGAAAAAEAEAGAEAAAKPVANSAVRGAKRARHGQGPAQNPKPQQRAQAPTSVPLPAAVLAASQAVEVTLLGRLSPNRMRLSDESAAQLLPGLEALNDGVMPSTRHYTLQVEATNGHGGTYTGAASLMDINAEFYLGWSTFKNDVKVMSTSQLRLHFAETGKLVFAVNNVSDSDQETELAPTVPSSPTIVDSVTEARTDTGSGGAEAADDVADAPLTATTAGQESSPCTEIASQPGDSHAVENEAAADSRSRGIDETNSAPSPTKHIPEPHPLAGETANETANNTDNGQRESNRETLLKRECKAASVRASAEAARADGLQQRVDELQSNIAEKNLIHSRLESRIADSESECAAQLKKIELRDSEIQRLKEQSAERQGAADRQAKLRQLLERANQQAQSEAQTKLQEAQSRSLEFQQAAQMRDSEKLSAEVKDLKQQLIEAQEAGAGLALTSMSAAAAGVNAAATAATAAAAAEVVVLKRHVAKLQKERAIAQQQRDGALVAAEIAEERLTLRLK